MEEIKKFFRDQPEEFPKILSDLENKIQTVKSNGETQFEAGIMLRAPREAFIIRMEEDTTNPIAAKNSSSGTKEIVSASTSTKNQMIPATW